VIDAYRDLGVTRLVALRGDPPLDEPDPALTGYETAADLVAAIRARPDGDRFDISVAAYPEVHPKAASARADLDNLKRKVDAGADRAITQFFFDNDVFLRFRDRALAAGIDVPIVPGIMPVNNFAGVTRFAGKCGAAIPGWLAGALGGLDDDPEIQQLVAASIVAEQCQQLADNGVDAFHFYTLNRRHLASAACHRLAPLAVGADGRHPAGAGAGGLQLTAGGGR
jgi:methylenetetrahydrofolate reductase (NADPH)